jgi:pimeloyl-ACP methyl ester carboxylesterase
LTLLVLLTASLPGCEALIPGMIVDAPNRGRNLHLYEPPSQKSLNRRGISQELRIAVGPPHAQLRVWILNPDSQTHGRPDATILVLHGFHNRAEWMYDTARDFAKAGYRAIIVEMRGHGKSTGEFVTFGSTESRDLHQVTSELYRQGLIVGDLGVWGISMGAATAIKLAAIDHRIDTVVAVAPYTDLTSVVPSFMRVFMPVYGWMVDEQTVTKLVDDAAARAGFDPADTDTVTAIAQVRVPVLLIHGSADWLVPLDMSRRLAEAAPPGSKFVELPYTGHFGAMLSDEPERLSIAWFREHLGLGR